MITVLKRETIFLLSFSIFLISLIFDNKTLTNLIFSLETVEECRQLRVLKDLTGDRYQDMQPCISYARPHVLIGYHVSNELFKS